MCVAIFDGSVAICRNCCRNFFHDFLRKRDDFMSTLRILSQLSQLFWVSTFSLNFSSDVNNFLYLNWWHVFIPLFCIGKIVLRFHQLYWCVLQFSVDMSPFVAIVVAIFFLIFSEIGMISWVHSGFCRNCRNYFEFFLLVKVKHPVERNLFTLIWCVPPLFIWFASVYKIVSYFHKLYWWVLQFCAGLLPYWVFTFGPVRYHPQSTI